MKKNESCRTFVFISLPLLFFTASASFAEKGEVSLKEKKVQIQSRLNKVFGKNVKLNCYLKPCWLQSDFDGDGKADLAVPIVKNGKKCIAFLTKKPVSTKIVGCDGPVKRVNYKDEVSGYFDDVLWSLRIRKEANHEDEDISEIHSNFIEIEGEESSSPGYLFWDGKSYVIFQVSD